MQEMMIKKNEEMLEEVANYTSDRGYERFDFVTVTFLYYLGQANGFANFKAIRPCEAEEYEKEKQAETIKIDLDELPFDLLDQLDYQPKTETEARKLNNINKIILLFNEGTESQSLVVLNPETYRHTAHLAFKPEWGQLNSIQGLKSVALELLRSKCDDDSEKDEDILELERTTECLGTLFRTCTVKKCDDYTKILSFRSASRETKSLDEVVASFLETAGNEVVDYCLTDKVCQVIVKAPFEEVNGEQPVYVLCYSDTGFAENSIAAGWYDGLTHFMSKSFSLNKDDYDYEKVIKKVEKQLKADATYMKQQSQIPLTKSPVTQASEFLVDARRSANLKASFPGNKIMEDIYLQIQDKKFDSVLDLKKEIITGISAKGLKASNKALFETKGAGAIIGLI